MLHKLKDPLVRGYLKRNITALIDVYFRRDGSSRPPWLVTLQPTDMCNLHCKMCNQWKQSGTRPNALSAPRKNLPPQAWKGIIEDIAQFKPIIAIWGGEPLLYPGILELLEFIKQAGLLCYLITNGTRLERFAADLVTLGIDGIMVSVDGPKHVHDAIRGIPGAFDSTFAGLRQFVRLRENSRKRPTLTINAVIGQDNYRYIREIVDIGRTIHADIISLILVLFITKEMGQLYEAKMNSLFGCQAHHWYGWVANPPTINTEYLRDVIRELRINRVGNTPEILLAPNIDLEELDEFFSNPQRNPRYKRCLQSYFEANITPSGGVNFCYEYQDLIFGNLCTERFATIWNNDIARIFRRHLNKQIFPICSRCCKFDVYPITRYLPRKLVL